MSRPTQARWFTAAQFEVGRSSGADGGAVGAHHWIAHAKQMGTNLTACGANAFTWSKLWHVRFDHAGPVRCRACIAVVAGSLPRAAR